MNKIIALIQEYGIAHNSIKFHLSGDSLNSAITYEYILLFLIYLLLIYYFKE